MGHRDGLVLETRLDKNGLPVRRWVRPQGRAGARAVPAPALSAKQRMDAALGDLVEIASDRLQLSDSMGRQLRQEASSYSVDTVQRLIGSLASGRPLATAGSAVRMVLTKEAEVRVREFLAFAPRLDGAERTSVIAEAAIRGLHEYRAEVGVPELEDLTAADEHAQTFCRALVTVAHGMALLDSRLTSLALDEIDPAEDADTEDYEPEGEPMPAIKDWGLIQLLREHPEDAEDIVTVIGQRGFESADRLREILYEGSRSLAEGHL